MLTVRAEGKSESQSTLQGRIDSVIHFLKYKGEVCCRFYCGIKYTGDKLRVEVHGINAKESRDGLVKPSGLLSDALSQLLVSVL